MPLASALSSSLLSIAPARPAALSSTVSLTPRAIRERLRLDHPIYERTAAYGHFGRPPDVSGGFTWERLDLVPALRDATARGRRGAAASRGQPSAAGAGADRAPPGVPVC
jgi:hypothetical protein